LCFAYTGLSYSPSISVFHVAGITGLSLCAGQKCITFKRLAAKHRWLMPVILVTKEAEISRIEVPSQPGQIVCQTKIYHRKGLVEWIKV
jgi:hypothetical protein